MDKVVKSIDGTEELLTGDHCSKISMMDERMTEDIYLLILQHYTSNVKGKKQALLDGKDMPYGARSASKEGKGLMFKLASIPPDLQKIIVRYLKIVSN